MIAIILAIVCIFMACADVVTLPECEGLWMGECVSVTDPADHFPIAVGFRYDGSRLYYSGTIDGVSVQGAAGYSDSGRIVWGAFDGKLNGGCIEGRWDGKYTFALWRR